MWIGTRASRCKRTIGGLAKCWSIARKGWKRQPRWWVRKTFLLFHTQDITSSEALVYFKCESVDEFLQAKKRLQSYVAEAYPDASVSFSPSGNLFDMIFSSGEPDLRLKLQDAGGHRPTVSQAMAFTDSLRQHFPEVMIPPVVTEENLQLVADVEQMTIYGISYAQLCDRLRQISGTNEALRINQGAGKRACGDRFVEGGQGVDIVVFH